MHLVPELLHAYSMSFLLCQWFGQKIFQTLLRQCRKDAQACGWQQRGAHHCGSKFHTVYTGWWSWVELELPSLPVHVILIILSLMVTTSVSTAVNRPQAFLSCRYEEYLVSIRTVTQPHHVQLRLFYFCLHINSFLCVINGHIFFIC